jgi:hypothetical protein
MDEKENTILTPAVKTEITTNNQRDMVTSKIGFQPIGTITYSVSHEHYEYVPYPDRRLTHGQPFRLTGR